MSATTLFLRQFVDRLVIDFANVHRRRMFGCDAWFVQGNIFALALPDERRIGVRLTDPSDFSEAMGLSGAAPFAPGTAPMKHWVLLPPGALQDEELAEKFLGMAYRLASVLPPRQQKNRSERL